MSDERAEVTHTYHQPAHMLARQVLSLFEEVVCGSCVHVIMATVRDARHVRVNYMQLKRRSLHTQLHNNVRPVICFNYELRERFVSGH